MDEELISLRLRHAGAAVLQESASSTGGGAEYGLVPPHWGNDELRGPGITPADSGKSLLPLSCGHLPSHYGGTTHQPNCAPLCR